MKEKILKLAYFIWAVILPFSLGGFFAIGVFMCMWDIWLWPLWLCIVLAIIIFGGCIFLVGKMIGKW